MTPAAHNDAVSKAVAPSRPDEPGVPFPPLADDAYDAELESLALERERRSTTALAAVRLLAIVAAAAFAFALRNDLRFAFASHSPVELSTHATAAELDAASHHLVALKGIPGGVGAVDYRRPTSNELYRLAPLVERPDVYVELRLPEGIDPTRFVPPTSLRGRLVPMDEGGVRFADARGIIERATGHGTPAKTWLLEQGAEPSWTSPAALVAMIAIAIGAIQATLLASDLRKKPAR